MKKRHLLFITVIVLLGIISYSNTYHCSFHFDDKGTVLQNPTIKHISNFLSISTLKNNRYITLLTFALNYKLNGLNVTGYHIVNNAIHVINAVLVYFLVITLFDTPLIRRSTYRGISQYIALCTSLVFVTHPIQTQAVTYIAQRFASLATLFYLLSVLSYLKTRINYERNTRLSYIYYTVSFFSAVLAMKSKETAFTLPFVIAVFDMVLFRETQLRKRLLFLFPIILTSLIIPLSLLHIDKPLGEVIGDVSEKTRVQTNISRMEYFFTELRVIVTYIRLLFLPLGQNLDYDYPIYRSLFTPSVFLSFLFLSGLFLTGAYLCVKARARDGIYTLLGLGILWFFITLSVESSFIPIVDVIFEHRVYLPSFGAFVSIVTVGFLLFEKVGIDDSKKVLAFWLAVAIVLSALTFSRNRVWKDDLTLWTDVVKKSPDKARGYNGVGYALKEQGRIDEAIMYFKRAIQLEPTYARARNNLANAYFEKGQLDDAIKEFKALLDLYKNYAEAYYNLGVIYERLGKTELAFKLYKTAIKYKKAYPEAYNNIGLLLKRQGRYKEAINHLLMAVQLKPEFADAHYNLGNTYYLAGRYQEAVREYLQAIRYSPNEPDYYHNLAMAYRRLGKDELARKYLAISNSLRR